MFNWFMELTHIHRFCKWEITKRGIVKNDGDDIPSGEFIVQERSCESCGITQVKRTRF